MPSAEMSAAPAADRAGLIAAFGCYGLWGLLPLLFQAVERAGGGAVETVAWRTLFSIPVAAALVIWTRQGPALRALGLRGGATLGLSAALIAFNWLVYVWAVHHGRTLEGSLGYYLNPLLNMAAGALLFGERISRAGWAAIALASVGVALQAAALGAVPWVSLALALSFCGYGIVRKRSAAPAQGGLLVECLLLAGPAAAYLAGQAAHGGGVFGGSVAATALLAFCGPATVAPLALFAFATQRLPLTIMGFVQFLAPTLQFAIGVEGGEALTPLRLVSFGFIWAGVAVFAVAALRRTRGARRAGLETTGTDLRTPAPPSRPPAAPAR